MREETGDQFDQTELNKCMEKLNGLMLYKNITLSTQPYQHKMWIISCGLHSQQRTTSSALYHHHQNTKSYTFSLQSEWKAESFDMHVVIRSLLCLWQQAQTPQDFQLDLTVFQRASCECWSQVTIEQSLRQSALLVFSGSSCKALRCVWCQYPAATLQHFSTLSCRKAN